MSKNRRKSLRLITVGDKKYFWGVLDPDCDGDGGCRFKIWEDKKVIYEKLIHNETITPKMVREIIERR